MNNDSTYYTDLITRYFSGEIQEDELRLLSKWLNADAENEKLFSQFNKTWLLVEKHRIHSTISTDQEWIAMKAKMHPSVEVIPFTMKRSSLKVRFMNSWKVAATITILLASSVILYFYLSKPANIIITAQASNLEQVLPDGSVVSLHAGSQISYPAKFSSGNRNVELSGEAYFRVEHDKTKPFIVASGDARIEVLGTQFNVNTHTSAGDLEVVLTSGKVSVYYKEKSKEKVILLPGEKAIISEEQNEILKTANSDPNYMAWKTRVLVFSDETLLDVLNTLEEVYQIYFELADSRLAECRFTATFNNQSLQSVLEVIKETLELEVNQKGDIIEVSGKGCR